MILTEVIAKTNGKHENMNLIKCFWLYIFWGAVCHQGHF
jgi:hypothetical protein